MKRMLIAAVLLLSPMLALAQADGNTAPKPNSQRTSPFNLPNGLDLPKGLFDSFWDDPAMAAELQLTATQKKQLRAAALKQQLALVDGGADAVKALVHVSAILNAEDLDDAAYRQQLDNFSASFGKIIRDVGEMAIAPRRILSPEQYQKLKSLQRAKREAACEANRETARDAARSTPKRTEIPSSLLTPLSK
jgi:Spy/CpxP family protein refolding chaperone